MLLIKKKSMSKAIHHIRERYNNYYFLNKNIKFEFINYDQS